MSMRMADEVMFEGDVLQQPTMPVVNETNMKKKATMKSAIIARPMSEIKNKGLLDAGVCTWETFKFCIPRKYRLKTYLAVYFA